MRLRNLNTGIGSATIELSEGDYNRLNKLSERLKLETDVVVYTDNTNRNGDILVDQKVFGVDVSNNIVLYNEKMILLGCLIESTKFNIGGPIEVTYVFKKWKLFDTYSDMYNFMNKGYKE